MAARATAATPTRKASSDAGTSSSRTAASLVRTYRLRLSPRATATLTMPQPQSAPAAAAPYAIAKSPPMLATKLTTAPYAPGNSSRDRIAAWACGPPP